MKDARIYFYIREYIEMREQCRVAEAERQHDVEWIEPRRHKAKFTGLDIKNKSHQKLLLDYAADELEEKEQEAIRYSLDKINENKKDGCMVKYCTMKIYFSMANIQRIYIVDFLETELHKHCEDWLYENYGVYEPWEV